MKLTDNACRTNTLGKKSDGGGLYLNIRSKTSRLWQMAYRCSTESRRRSPSVPIRSSPWLPPARRATGRRRFSLRHRPRSPCARAKPRHRPFQSSVASRTVASALVRQFRNLSDQYRLPGEIADRTFHPAIVHGPRHRTITSPEVVTMLRAIEATGISLIPVRRCRQFHERHLLSGGGRRTRPRRSRRTDRQGAGVEARASLRSRPRVPQSEIRRNSCSTSRGSRMSRCGSLCS